MQLLASQIFMIALHINMPWSIDGRLWLHMIDFGFKLFKCISLHPLLVFGRLLVCYGAT